MVKLNKIYTRTGDDGSTGLGDGTRVRKDDARVAAYGAVDELNSALGLARLGLEKTLPDLAQLVDRVQNDLFDLGADLCVPEGEGEAPNTALRIINSQVDFLEKAIDRLNADLKPLHSFILPGGSAASAHFHLARTIARRAERDMVHLTKTTGTHVNEAALMYINRLSDLLFVMARVANNNGEADVLWVPGLGRASD